jgi:hypothetical protein
MKKLKTDNKMKATLNFGKIDYNSEGKNNLVTIKIELKENSKGKPIFSASGSIWNSNKSDIEWGGQCIDDIYNYFKDQLENVSLYKEVMQLWERNHLNDLNAGTFEQENAIKEWKKQGNTYDFVKVCEYLKSINLYEVERQDISYKYGSSWIYREIPSEDLNRIKEIILSNQ